MIPGDYSVLLVAIAVTAYVLWRFEVSVPWAIITPVCAAGVLVAHWMGLTVPQAAATGIFVFCYILIASEKFHKAKVALVGATAMLVFGLIDQHTALHGTHQVEGTDWNTIFLLIGMMVIVNITRQTGVFEWIAIKAAKLAKGRPILIIIFLCIATAVLSAALDNVTTVLLIAPVTILICESLKVDPVPFLAFVILASNIGGTATLVGDPPNIMIASAASLTFNDFLIVNAPAVLVILPVYLATVWLTFHSRIQTTEEQRAQVMEFDETRAITDGSLLLRCGMIIGLVLVGFGFHGMLGLEPATIALAGAAVLLLIAGEDPEEMLEQVEWPTIFFFIGLFIMVSTLVHQGVVRMIGHGIIRMACGPDIHGGLNPQQLTNLTLAICWFAAIASGIVDNIPFVATMNAVLKDMATTLHPNASSALAAMQAPDIIPLWWALSLGACLGGNFTLVGASANVVVAGIAERSEHPISFVRFMKYGVPITLQGIVLSSVYLWLRFLR